MEPNLSRRRLLGTAITAGVAGAGVRRSFSNAAATQKSTRWPMYNLDAANTGHHPTGTGPKAGVDRKWTFETELQTEAESSAVVADGTVYLGSRDGTLHAVTAEDGRPIWSFETEEGVFSSPAVVGGNVYIADMRAVYAVSAADGSRQWIGDMGSGPTWSPVVVDGVVYLTSFEARVAAFDASDGSELWAAETETEIFSAPAVTDDAVYVTMLDGSVSAFDAGDGSRRWTTETSEQVPSPPAVMDGTVYVASDEGTLYALDAEDGSERWTFETDDAILGSPGLADDTVYVGSHDQNFYALDPDDGSVRWVFEADGEFVSSPVVVDGMIYVGTRDGSVFGLNRADGTERWSVQTNDRIPPFSSLAVAGGTIYVPTESGVYHAFTAGTGGAVTATVTPSPTRSATPTRTDPDTRTEPPINDVSGAGENGPLTSLQGPPGLMLLGGVGVLTAGAISVWKIFNAGGDESTAATTASASAADSWDEAETALSDAAEAESDGDFVRALDAYERGIQDGEIALETLPEDDERREEIAAVLERAREKRDDLQAAHAKRAELVDTLENAETHFQTAIAAPASDKIVIPRERYRQARNAYDDALDLLDELEGDVLEQGVTVTPEPTVDAPAENLAEFPGVHPEAQAFLDEQDLDTLAALRDADADTLSTLRDDAAFDERLGLRLAALSQWHAGGDVEYTGREAIQDRYRLADEAYEAHRQ